MSVFNELSAWLVVLLVVVIIVLLFIGNYQTIARYVKLLFDCLFGDLKTRRTIKNRERLYHRQEQKQQEMQRQRFGCYDDDVKYRKNIRRR